MQRKTIYNQTLDFLKSICPSNNQSSDAKNVTVRVVQKNPFLFTDDNIHFFELSTPLEQLEYVGEEQPEMEDWKNSINKNQKLNLKGLRVSLRKVPYKHEWFFNISCEGLEVINQKEPKLNNILLDKLKLKSPLEDDELNHTLKTLNRKLTEKIVREKFLRESEFGAPIENHFQGEGIGLVLRKRGSGQELKKEVNNKRVKTKNQEVGKENKVIV